MIDLLPLILVLIATVIGSFGSVFLKKGANKLSFNIRALLKNYSLIIGIILYVTSSVFYIIALRFGELTVIYPLTSLSYVYISLLSVKFLNERMNTSKWSGIVLIIIGVISITR